MRRLLFEDRTLTETEQVEAHRSKVRAIVHRCLSPTFDREEVEQEVLVRAVDQLSRMPKPPSNFGAWISGVAVNTCADVVRKRMREQSHLERAGAELPPYVASTAEESAEHAELRRAVDELPPALQVPVALHYLKDFTVREIEEMTGVPRSTVQDRLRRGLAALRRMTDTGGER